MVLLTWQTTMHCYQLPANVIHHIYLLITSGQWLFIESLDEFSDESVNGSSDWWHIQVWVKHRCIMLVRYCHWFCWQLSKALECTGNLPLGWFFPYFLWRRYMSVIKQLTISVHGISYTGRPKKAALTFGSILARVHIVWKIRCGNHG